ncbi:hypothetical protein BJ165DRAFT_1401072 [Panaeolus papilionaceus]|nr:hypothetical protein BJ165DRAFT_1401072 [Panaeolus papilionaceus]
MSDLRTAGVQAGVTLGVLAGPVLILILVCIYKRNPDPSIQGKWKRKKKQREAEGNDFPLRDVERGQHRRGVHRADTEDPALPVYQRSNPQDRAEQLAKLSAEVQRLEALPEPLSVEQQGLLADLKSDAALLRTQVDSPQVPPPTYATQQTPRDGPQMPMIMDTGTNGP